MRTCKNCQKEIMNLEVVEITTNRIITKYSEGKLEIGDKLIIKHTKKFKCPHCHILLFTSKNKALKWLNK